MLTERGRTALRGIERADSVTLDPHKSLFLPFGLGCLLVREPDALIRAHEVHSDYVSGVASQAEGTGCHNFADMSAEMSRELRGLKVWLPLKIVGASTFRRYLDEKLDLAEYAAHELRKIADIDVVAPPELSILAFRAQPPGLADEAQDALNERIMARVNRSRSVHLSPTLLHGRFTIRICVLPFRTHRAVIDACLAAVREAVSEELAAFGASA